MEVRCIGDYDLIRPVVLDGYCRTYLGEHRFLKKEVVIKLIDSVPLSSADNLIKIFAKIDHPNLIKPLVVEQEDDRLILVYDSFLDASYQSLNLYDFLSQHEVLTEELILSILTQVASAIDYLSANRLGYANLKLSNCLIQSISKTELSLGLVDYLELPTTRTEEMPIQLFEKTWQLWNNRSLESKEDLISKHQLALSFLAPEIHSISANKNSLNIYSFGILTYFLLTKMVPHPFLQLPSKLRVLQLNWDLMIESCLQFQADARPKEATFAIDLVYKKPVEIIKKETKVQEIITEIGKNSGIKTLEPSQVQEMKPVLKAQELIRPTFDPDPAQIFHADTIIAPYKPKEKEHIEIMPIQTEMVIISEGEYTRGSNEGARDERPAHKVLLGSFAMDIHPVTNEQFVRFLEVMGGEKDNHNNDLIRLRESRIKRSAGKLIIESGYAKHPVVGVSWYGALGYAKWVGKRLPTEAEWEVASRSLKSDMIYPTGLNIERTHANYFSADTTPVMSYPPIDIGLYDIAGNVYEWCHDWYDYNFYESSLQEPTNPKGPQQGVYRVLRGGCWKSLKDDLRCAHRHRNNPGTVNKTYGFRCAADVEVV